MERFGKTKQYRAFSKNRIKFLRAITPGTATPYSAQSQGFLGFIFLTSERLCY
jgi:hypothetical protein